MNGAPTNLSAEKQTLVALRALRRRVEELEAAAADPIAIIGMACRFPGGVNAPEEFWILLRDKRDAICEIPSTRLNLKGIYAPFPAQPGKTYSRWAGLLAAPQMFDAEFFGISPREAAAMDPQQRMLLEVSWEALEDAAIDPKSLAGKNGGVFVGVSNSEYAQRALRILPREQLGAYALQGAALNAGAGRLSYFYGLNGPAMAIDSACSSSLVAVDRACRSLRERESALALAAGANLIATPEAMIITSQWGMLSPTGKICAFDARADGFVRGEGCGVLVLKRLSDAKADGDRIHAVIIGSAVNQDGASSGLTVPNGLAQQALLREACRRAGIEPSQVGYVEAHGTGTTLGDPIEAEALAAVFARQNAKLAIGSVKTNIGHLESAAGIAGLMKLALSLEHGVIPAQLHWENPSGHVHWEELPLEVVTSSRPWNPIGGRVIGGVSSFGFSGTNAHMLLEAAYASEPTPDAAPHLDILPLSARTEPALRELSAKHAAFLEQTTSDWTSICRTAETGRALFGERLAVVADSPKAAAKKLRAWITSRTAEAVHRGQVTAGQRTSALIAAGTPPDEAAAQFVQGARFAEKSTGHRVTLPTYAFQRESYWIEERPTEAALGVQPNSGDALGQHLPTAGTRGQFETILTANSWVGEHEIQGQAVLPATGHMELMLEAGADLTGGTCALEDVVIESRLDVDGRRRVQTVVEAELDGRCRVRIYAEREGGWDRFSEGWLTPPLAESPAIEDLDAIRSRLTEHPAGDDFYASMAERGVCFGPHFRGVVRLWAGETEALGEIVTTEGPNSEWQIAPWWLDACLQVAAPLMDCEHFFLPMSCQRIDSFGKPGPRTFSHIRVRQTDADTLVVDTAIFTPDGAPVAALSNLRFRAMPRPKVLTGAYDLRWTELRLGPARDLSGSWLLISEDDATTDLCRRLDAHGAEACVISGASAEDAASFKTRLRSSVPLQGIVDLRAAAPASNLDDPVVACSRVVTLLQVLLREPLELTAGIVVVTRNANASPAAAAVRALCRSAALEFPELKLHWVDLEGQSQVQDLISIFESLDHSEIAVRDGHCVTSELAPLPIAPTAENTELVVASSGLIEDLKELPSHRHAPGPGEIEIAVEVQGVNFRDVLNALGMLPGMAMRLGGECAGTVVRAGSASGFAPGDRVFAFAPGSFQQYVTTSGTHAARIPDNLTVEEAAALPIAYFTALFGIKRLAALEAGESILIHAATGGLGLAAVHLAKARGAFVYATAGSEEKRAFLRSLGVTHVASSRSTDFSGEVMRLTQNRGVDVVLNSLTGELAAATLAVLAPGGRFLEVGKRKTLSAEDVRRLRPDVHHFVYDLGQEAEHDSSLMPVLFSELLLLLKAGSIPALPVTTFSDPREAFRFMAQARHTGKLVVRRAQSVQLPLRVDSQATYLITGGCGGLGLVFAEALAQRGARHLVLVGRHVPTSVAAATIEKLRSYGIDITVAQADVADRDRMAAVLTAIPAAIPLRGVLHAAGVLDDRSLLKQTEDSLRAVFLPKWQGAWNLHTLTQGQPLDFFILFSSAAALLGSPGQTNYVAANAAIDALAVQRHAQGLPALSVQWGPWRTAGMAQDLRTSLEARGLGRIEPPEGIAAVEALLRSGATVAAVLPVLSWPRLRRKAGNPYPTTSAPAPAADKARTTPSRNLIDEIRDATPADRRAELYEHLRQQTVRILSFPENRSIDEDEALHDLGLDSLMAVELRNALSASLERPLSPTLVLDYPTLRTLTDYLLTEVFGHDAQSVPQAATATGDDLAAMSEEEAEALLLQEMRGGSHGGR